MIYNEEHVATARNVIELIEILNTKLPKEGFLEVHAPEHSADCEVWYDKDTDTVILK
jgi:lysyl-tRNA synthetase class II